MPLDRISLYIRRLGVSGHRTDDRTETQNGAELKSAYGGDQVSVQVNEYGKWLKQAIKLPEKAPHFLQ
jgi:fibrillarin-like rRNA methylase